MKLHAAARKVALIFAAVSALWIVASHLVIARVIPTGSGHHLATTIKDGIFLLGTAVLIYVLVRRAGRPLQQEHDWYSELFALSPDAVLVTDRSGVILAANMAAIARYGRPQERLIGTALRDLSPPGDREAFDARLAEALAGEGSFEWRQEDRDGHVRVVELAVRSVERFDQPCILCLAHDLTARRAAEEALRASEERFRTLFTGNHMVMLVIDPRTCTIVDANPAAERFYGWSVDELRDLGVAELDVEPVACGAPLPSPGPDGQIPPACHRHRRADGLVLDVEVRCGLLPNAEGTRVLATVQDISDRRRAEAELRESERRFRKMVEEAPLPMLIHADDGEILASSHALSELTGHPMAELRTIDDWTRLAYGKRAPEIAARIVATHQLTGRGDQGEFRVRCRDGSQRLWHFFATPLGRLPDGRHAVISAAVDVTERRQAEDEREALQLQFFHAQRLEAVGRLAGGIAHDFNNILQAMMGYANLLLAQVPDPGLMREGLEEIHRGSERATALTSQLLAFSRRQVMDPVVLDLNDLVAAMLRMVRRVIGEDVRLEWQPGADLAPVRADRGMLEQVLMNLCVNARDAMPGGGLLTVRTDEVTLDEDLCARRGWSTPGPYVALTVSDTGAGIPDELRDRIFEPFFTTKDDGQGTGLGLATVYGIVSQHTGMLHVESTPGHGTVFRVYLPVCADAADEPVYAEIPPALGGTETILVAEDDRGVRNLAARVLSAAGYRVLTAADGQEAVDCFHSAGEGIDLVLLDVVMPRVGGEAALRSMSHVRPGVPAVFSSGYAEGGIHTDFVLNAGLTLLRKPYTPTTLLRAVRDKLDAVG